MNLFELVPKNSLRCNDFSSLLEMILDFCFRTSEARYPTAIKISFFIGKRFTVRAFRTMLTNRPTNRVLTTRFSRSPESANV